MNENLVDYLAQHVIACDRCYGTWHIEEIGRLAIVLHCPGEKVRNEHRAMLEMLAMRPTQVLKDYQKGDSCFVVLTDADCDQWHDLSELAKEVIENCCAGMTPQRVDMPVTPSELLRYQANVAPSPTAK